MISGSVLARTSSTVTPGARSRRARPAGVTSITARSVMIRARPPGRCRAGCTPRRSWGAVLGDVLHQDDHPPGAVDRSIAPPMPLTILPGIIQLAMSPRGDLHGAEDRDVDPAAADHPEARGGVEEGAPGSTVMVSFPALIRSGTSCPPSGTGRRRGRRSRTAARVRRRRAWLGTRVGRPIPRLT